MSTLLTALISSAIVILGALTTYITTHLKKTKNHKRSIESNRDRIEKLEKELKNIKKKK